MNAPTTPRRGDENARPPASGQRKAGAMRALEADLICLRLHTSVLVAPVATPCGHGFCKGCIARWLETRAACPTCRAPVGTPPNPRGRDDAAAKAAKARLVPMPLLKSAVRAPTARRASTAGTARARRAARAQAEAAEVAAEAAEPRPTEEPAADDANAAAAAAGRR